MPITESEARQKALADGILPEHVDANPAILAYYGCVISSPTAGLQVGAVIPTEQVKADLLALDKERQAGAVPQQILAAVTGLLGWAKSSGLLALSLALALILTGCGPSVEAVKSVDSAAISVKALNDQHLQFEDLFIQSYVVKETARIQQLHEAAMAGSVVNVTQMVEKTVKVPVKAADGSEAFKEEKQMVQTVTAMVPKDVSDGLQKQRVRLLQEMANNVILMRAQQALICQNAANAASYLEGLKAYFEQRQTTYESLLNAQKSLFDFLNTFVKKDETSAPALKTLGTF